MNEKIKILYVDDEEVNIFLFKVNFSKTFELLTADSGVKGLEVLDEYQDVKVVISDMKMPIMNGIEFIKKTKSKNDSLKFFLLTGFDIIDEIQDALNTNLILKYFKKPFNKVEIESSINEAIK